MSRDWISLRSRFNRRSLLQATVAGGLLSAASALLAACGGTSDDDEEPTATSGGSEGAAPTATTSDAPSATEPASEATSAPDGVLGTIRMGQASDLDTLDPTRIVQTPWRRVYGHIFDPLFHRAFDENGQPQLVPKLAVSFEQEDDLTVVFSLREGVTFSNGEPFNADAVIFTWQKMLDPISQAAGTAGRTANIEAVDDYTIRVSSDEPDPFLLDNYVDTTFIVPPLAYEEMGAEEFSLNPVGTGPYVLDKWRQGDSIILQANPDYWGGPPIAEGVVFRVIPEASTRVDALLAGEVDIVEGVTPLLAERIEGSEEARLSVAVGSPQPIWGGLMTDRPPLDDKRVRQAINYAVNKQAIADRILQGYAEPMGQPCAQGTDCYNPDIDPYPYDPDRAKELLQEAGVQDVEIPLQFSNGVTVGGREIAQAIVSDLAAVGITVSPTDVERGVFLSDFTDGQGHHEGLGDTFIMYYAAGVRPQNVIFNRVLESSDPWNATHYNNPEVDRLIQESKTSFDPAEREPLYYQIAEIVHEDAPFLFLYAPRSIWGVSKSLKWEAQPDDMMWVFPESFPV